MDISTIRARNIENGMHFFDRSTMRFFKSKVPKGTYTNAAGTHAFFVTSEQGPDMVRKFTVRVCELASGAVSTHGEFQAHSNATSARNAAKQAAKS